MRSICSEGGRRRAGVCRSNLLDEGEGTRDRDQGSEQMRVEADVIHANECWIRICVQGGLIGGMSMHRKDQADMGNIPFKFHRTTRTFVLDSQ